MNSSLSFVHHLVLSFVGIVRFVFFVVPASDVRRYPERNDFQPADRTNMPQTVQPEPIYLA
ncbi:hypothetical protein BH18ACI2_BH18ACI2_03470 [soil metagenome]